MDVNLVAVGRLKAGPEAELATRFLDRARQTGRGLGFRGFNVRELAESRAAREVERKLREADDILASIADGDRVVCLDEGGEAIGSRDFAEWLRRDADAGFKRCCLIIGGPDGLSDGVLSRAERTLSLGRLTWPHQLVRLLVAEQLYRAMTILAGHPYHRA